MARSRTNPPLDVYLNSRLVGQLTKAASGAIAFQYNPSWLATPRARPVSRALPLQQNPHVGAPVAAIIENLLPDNDAIRRIISQRVGAGGQDAYSILAQVGRDCVGALQFVPHGLAVEPVGTITAETVTEGEVAEMLRGLTSSPLGITRESAFRISVAGAQEKTALLWHEECWKKPLGATPTTHILKPQIRTAQDSEGTIDLTNSVENEFYCLNLLRAFGLQTAHVAITDFEDIRTLVVERFDRRWLEGGRLLRIPQEDLCQALAVPPSQKYQDHGGPGAVDVLNLLLGSEAPEEDRRAVFSSLVLFWLMGATDGHAKNFSIFLLPDGGFRLAPLYDVLTTQPMFDRNQIRHKDFKLAMSLGTSRHYKILSIRHHHIIETAKAAGISPQTADRWIAAICDQANAALDRVTAALPPDFPDYMHASVAKAMRERIEVLAKRD